MGASLTEIVKASTINPLLSFFVPYLSNDKLSVLMSMNEDYLFDEEMFCSFFLCHESYFLLFDNGTGYANFWEIMIAIYLIKPDIFKTKINNIWKLFWFDKTETLLTQDTFIFITDIFINTLKRMYQINTIADDSQNKLKEEIENYILSIFKAYNMQEVKILHFIK